MYSANIKNYKRIEVESATPGKLLLMLYDGAIEYSKLASQYIKDNNEIESMHYIGRVQAIITELMNSLNLESGGEIAMNLFALYEYMLFSLIEAGKSKALDKVLYVQELLEGLRDSWNKAIKGGIEENNNTTVVDSSYKIEKNEQSVAQQATAQKLNPYEQPKEKVKSLDISG